METGLIRKTATLKTSPVQRIFANKRFLILWMTSIMTGFAFSIYLISETWFVIRVLNAPSLLGVILLLTTVPRVLLMSVGGVLADRIRRTSIIFFVNGIRGLLIIVMVFLLFTYQLNLITLGIFALLFGILDAFYWPANQSILPHIVDKEQLVRANSLMQTSNQISLLFGPVLAGFIIKFGSFPLVFGLVSVLLIISSLLVCRVKEPAAIHTDTRPSLWLELQEGFAYVRSVPYLLIAMFTSIFINFFLTGPLSIGIPLIVDQQLKGDVLDLSYLESSLAAGMVGGAILIGWLNFRRKRPIIHLSFIIVLAISNMLLSQVTSLWQGLGALFIGGICLSICNVLSPSVVQEMTEKRMMGRVQSIMSTASMGFIPLSLALVSTLLSTGIPIKLIIFTSSIFMALFVLIVLFRSKVIRSID